MAHDDPRLAVVAHLPAEEVQVFMKPPSTVLHPCLSLRVAFARADSTRSTQRTVSPAEQRKQPRPVSEVALCCSRRASLRSASRHRWSVSMRSGPILSTVSPR